MKKNIFLFFILLTLNVFPQSSKEVFNSANMIWYGIDFSRVKILGSSYVANLSGTSLEEIRDKYFFTINEVLLDEKKKYDLPKFFVKDSVSFNLDLVKNRNLKVDISNIVSDDETSNLLKPSDIENIINEFEFGTDKGLGVLFIMEYMNRLNDEKSASMFVTFFDIASKKVILSERMVGEAGGFGLRNYWVKTVFNVLKQVEENIAGWAEKVQ